MAVACLVQLRGSRDVNIFVTFCLVLFLCYCLTQELLIIKIHCSKYRLQRFEAAGAIPAKSGRPSADRMRPPDRNNAATVISNK